MLKISRRGEEGYRTKILSHLMEVKGDQSMEREKDKRTVILVKGEKNSDLARPVADFPPPLPETFK